MHGPKPRSHAFKLNKKVRRLGLKIALSNRAAEGKASLFLYPNPRPRLLSEKFKLYRNNFYKLLCLLYVCTYSCLYIDFSLKKKKLLNCINILFNILVNTLPAKLARYTILLFLVGDS